MTRTILSSARLLLAAAGVVLARPLQAQTFEGILSVNSAGMPPQAGMQYFIKGERLRLELSTPGQPPIVLILDGPAKKQYVVFEDQKAYTTTTFADLLRSTDSVRKQAAILLQKASMTPLGTKATVAGHKCDLYRYRDPKTVNDICLTTDLGALGGVGGLWGHVGRAMEVSNAPEWAMKLVKAGFFALRLADTTGTTIWEVRKVDAQALAPVLFAPPSGYASMSDASGPKPPSPH